MSNKHIRFHELLERQLNSTLKKFLNEQLTPALMRSIREAIRAQLDNVFNKSSHYLSPNAMTWLCDQYFKGVKFNDQLMSDQVIINEYKLSELSYSDLALLESLFSETTMGPDITVELRKRVLS